MDKHRELSPPINLQVAIKRVWSQVTPTLAEVCPGTLYLQGTLPRPPVLRARAKRSQALGAALLPRPQPEGPRALPPPSTWAQGQPLANPGAEGLGSIDVQAQALIVQAGTELAQRSWGWGPLQALPLAGDPWRRGAP